MTTDEQAECIRSYWDERGYAVTVEIVERYGARFIRSDLVNGLPCGWRGEFVKRLSRETVDTYTPHLRPCMCCTRSFLSEHRFNRICDNCKSAPPSRARFK